MKTTGINRITMRYLLMAQYHGYKYVQIEKRTGISKFEPIMICRHFPFPPNELGSYDNKLHVYAYWLDSYWQDLDVHGDEHAGYFKADASYGDLFVLNSQHWDKLEYGRYDLTGDNPERVKS